MKVVKPMKVPILHRVVEHGRRPFLHFTAFVAAPIPSPRALLDELAFWPAVGAALGESPLDEGFAKARGEFLVAGRFHAPGARPVSASFVRVAIAGIDKRLAVLGDRHWASEVMTQPTPMTEIPLDWGRALGGPGFDRNPYGMGLAPVERGGRSVVPLPNVERYGALLRSPRERPEPAGFGPMDLQFAQRRARAGTYGKRWLEQDFPGLPVDAEPTFYNVAPEDQWLPGYFRGDEAFVLENLRADAPRVEGTLSGLRIRCFVTQRGAPGAPPPLVELPIHLDTVWFLTEANVVVSVFRGVHRVKEDDAADLAHLLCACEDPAAPREVAHYHQALARRLDKDRGAVAEISDADLMPPRERGVAPNIAELDMGRWLRGQNLPIRYARRGLERGVERTKEQLAAQERETGMAFGELPALGPPPEEPPAGDLDALADYVSRQLDEEEKRAAENERRLAELEVRAREARAEGGQDPDAALEQALAASAGPPKRKARERYAELEQMAALSREYGEPNLELEAALASPKTLETLLQQEEEAIQAYRTSAHFAPSAGRVDEETRARVAQLVRMAREAGEPLDQRDLTGLELPDEDLHGVSFAGSFLEGAVLSRADLSGANLERAVLAKAQLDGANLARADLRGANLGSADLTEAVLSGARLDETILMRADLRGARLDGATLAGADWTETLAAEVELRGAKLPKATFVRLDLTGARFDGAELEEATFVECALDGASFAGARLRKATFVACRGRGVSFRGASFPEGVVAHGSAFPEADLRDADLTRVNLRGTDLEGARLERANLRTGDISECNLRGARLDRSTLAGGMAIRADLEGASLRGADWMDVLASKARLQGADFTGARLFRADLSRVLGDERTTFAEAEVTQVRHLPKAEEP